ncbi:MAG: acyl carrier protein [Acidimicrobiia bacterium]|nr:acyl carrier protein [Acidimicrobiia bacterium]MDH5291594.1 acyl carrier protein [Acidimicrobiia bacterium]
MTTSSSTDLEAAVREAILSVAPDVEADLVTIDPDIDAFEELQLDSMDHLNVVTALARTTGVEIPESDYPGLRSLGALVRYLAERAAGG